MEDTKYSRNRQQVYDALKGLGYTADQIGESAEILFQDRRNGQIAYDILNKAGISGLGKNYKDFESLLFEPEQKPGKLPKQPEQEPVQYRPMPPMPKGNYTGPLGPMETGEPAPKQFIWGESRLADFGNFTNREGEEPKAAEAPAQPAPAEPALSDEERNAFIQEYEQRRNTRQQEINKAVKDAAKYRTSEPLEFDSEEDRWLRENSEKYRTLRGEQPRVQDSPEYKSVLDTVSELRNQAAEAQSPEQIIARQETPFSSEESRHWETVRHFANKAEQMSRFGSQRDIDIKPADQAYIEKAKQYIGGALNNIDQDTATMGLATALADFDARNVAEKNNKLITDAKMKAGFTGDFNQLVQDVEEGAAKLKPVYDELTQLEATITEMGATYQDMAQNGATEEELKAYAAKYNSKVNEYNKKIEEVKPQVEEYGKTWDTYNALSTAVSDALENGLTESEKAVLQALDAYTQMTAMRSTDMSVAAKAGQSFEQTMEFMLGFILTGGLDKAGGKAAAKMTRDFLSKRLGNEAAKRGFTAVAENIPEAMAKLGARAKALKVLGEAPGSYAALASVAKGGSKVVTDLGVAAARQALLLPRTLQEIGERELDFDTSEEKGYKDEYGRYRFLRSKANATLEGTLSSFAEFWTEGFGEYASVAEKALFKNLIKSAPKTTIGKTLTAYRGSLGQFLDKAKYNSLFNELIVEEGAGALLDALKGWATKDYVGNSEALKKFWSGENLATMFFSFLPLTVTSTINNLRAYNRMAGHYDAAVKTLTPLVESGAVERKDLEDLVNNIDSRTPQQLKDKVVEIADKARKANGGNLPDNFTQSLMGYVEGSLAMQLENDRWEASQYKVQVVSAYDNGFAHPAAAGAYDALQFENYSRKSALDAGFTEEQLDQDPYKLAQAAERMQEEYPDKAATLMTYASAKAQMMGLQDGYKKNTERYIAGIEKNIRENLAVNGNVVMAVLDGKLVYVTSPDITVNADGTISAGNGDGLVTYREQGGDQTLTAKAGQFTNTVVAPEDEYIRGTAEAFANQREALFQAGETTISPTGMQMAVDSKVGNTVYVRDGQGVYEPVEIVRTTDGGQRVVVKGGKNVLDGIASALGITAPRGTQLEVEATKLYPMLATEQDGSLSTEQPQGAPAPQGGQQAAPAQTTQAPAQQTAFNPEEHLGETIPIAYNGKVVNAFIGSVGDGQVEFTFTDAEGNERPGTLSVQQFSDAVQTAVPETPAAPEAPVQPETPQPPVQPETPQGEAPQGETPQGETPAQPEQPQSFIPTTKNGGVDWDNMFNVSAEEFEQRIPELLTIMDELYGKDAMKFAQAWYADAKKKLEVAQKITGNPKKDAENRAKANKAQELVSNYSALILAMQPQGKATAAAPQAPEAPEQPGDAGVPDISDDTPAAAQQRGYIMQNGNRIDRAAEDAVVAEGADTQISFAKNEVADAKYGLMEADRLVPSHTNDQENPLHFFAKTWQPKDRTKTDSKVAIQTMANNLRPEEITRGATAYVGAPIVNARGEVVQGNGRSEALIRAYGQGSADAYKAWLAEHAAEFGLTREQVESMKNPVLVREVKVDDARAEQLGQKSQTDLESGGEQTFTANGLAKKLGDRLDEFISLLFGGELGEDATATDYINNNGQLALDWLHKNGMISDTEYQNALNEKKEFTEATRSAFRALAIEPLFAGAPQKVREGYEKLPDNAKLALQRSVASLTKLEGVIPDIQEALSYYFDFLADPDFVRAKSMDDVLKTVEGWMNAVRMDGKTEGEAHPSIVARKLAAIFKATRSAKSLSVLFGEIAAAMKGEGDVFAPDAQATDRIGAYERANVISEEEANQIRNAEQNDTGTSTGPVAGETGESGGGQGSEAGDVGDQGGAGEVVSGEQAGAQNGEVTTPPEAPAQPESPQEPETPAEPQGNPNEVTPKEPSKAAQRAVATAQAWAIKLSENERGKLNAYRKLSLGQLNEEVKSLQRRVRNREAMLIRSGVDPQTDADIRGWKESISVIERYIASGEMAAKMALYGVKKNQKLTVEQIRDIFDHFNTDKELADLFDKVQQAASQLGMSIFFTDELSGSTLGNYGQSINTIKYKAGLLYEDGVEPWKVANTLLHELIHSVTTYALYLSEWKANMDAYDAGKTKRKGHYRQSAKDNINTAVANAPKELLDAAKALEDIYKQVRKSGIKNGRGQEAYGLKSTHEMIAELSNPEFREELKKVNLWDKIVAAIAKLINALTPKKDAYENLKSVLNQFLDNFDINLYHDVRDIQYNSTVSPRTPLKDIDNSELEAPNGQPSNLNEFQWHQVRTPEFRNYFGGWDIAYMETPILESKGSFKNLDEAEKWAKENLQGKSYNNAFTGESIYIGSKSIEEMLGETAAKRLNIDLHKAALQSVPEFIVFGIPAEMHPDTHGRGFNVMRLYSAININGDIYRVKSTVRKVKQGDRFYTYELQEMELTEERPQTGKGEEQSSRNPNTSTNSISGAKLLKGVKKTNSDEYILDHSAVVDENGEPRVVYHASNAVGITKFDKSKIRANETDAWYNGFWFSSDKDTLPAWVKKNALYRVYLDIRKPILSRDANKIVDEVRAKLEENEDAYPGARSIQDAVRMELQARGYDGVIHSEHAPIDFDELEREGQTVFKLANGLRYIIRKGDDYKYESYRYHYNPESKEYYEGDFDGGFDSIEDIKKDPYFFGEEVWVVFEPTQIKSAEFNNGDFDTIKEDILEKKEADDAYEKAIADGDMSAAQEMVDEAAIASGYTIRGEHGTTNKFTIFDRSKGNADGNWGKGFYFTNNHDDAEANYANTEGPDLTAKIERLAEQLEWQEGYEDKSYEERKEAATKMLSEGEPRIIEAALRMEKPLVLGGDNETFFDYNEEYDEENDEYGEPEGLLQDFFDAFHDLEWEWGIGYKIDLSLIYESAYDGGLTATELERLARKALADFGGVEDENGDIADGEFLRQVFENMGFDGIVDTNVNKKFGSERQYGRSMDGMDYGTEHYIVFSPEQIKQTDTATYDDEGNLIPLSERFDEIKPDIRYKEEEDPDILAELEKGPKQTAYRAMQEVDGELYPPMSAVVGSQRRAPIALGKWEKAEERPDLATEDGKFVLNKGNGKSLKAAYNPYFHSSNTMLNDQFSEAQSRPNLVVVEVEIPESELKGENPYRAERAKDAVGEHDWKAGVIQGKLTGTRKVYLTRWDKPVRIVPNEEVAQHIFEQVNGKIPAMPTNVVTPQVRQELEKLGMQFVSTNNKGIILEGPGRGKTYTKAYKELREAYDEITPEVERMEDARDADVETMFYSNALAAAERVPMEKATPEQWLKMLEKEGGLKAGEDKWIGLSDWLKASDKKTLTRQEVIDYIKANHIQLEEVYYAENADDYAKAMQSYIDEFEQLKSEAGAGDNQFEYAWREMVDRYGDDFELAFEQNGDSIMPTMDWQDDYTDAARYFLEQRTGDVTTREIPEIRKRYTTEGLDNKREIALTVPTIDPWNEGDRTHFGDAGEGRVVVWVRFGETKDENGKRVLFIDEIQSKRHQDAREQGGYKDDSARKRAEKKRDAISKELDDFLTRMDEKYKDAEKESASRMDIFSDEDRAEYHRLYSEWRLADNAATRNGFDPMEDEEYRRIKAELDANDDAFRDLREEWTSIMPEYKEVLREMPQSPERTNRILELGKRKQSIEDAMAPFQEKARELQSQLDDRDRELVAEFNRTHNSNVPPAPFEKNWHELALKRMLRYAAENGYDYVAWTTGDQQAERYDIGNEIDYIYREDDNHGERDYRLVPPAGGAEITIRTDEDGVVTYYSENNSEGKNLSEIVGKELAKKMLALEVDDELSGDNIRVGNEGMKGFYDQMLVNYMNKYGKKWGVKVEDIELPELWGQPSFMKNDSVYAHSVPVNEEMRQSVMAGQPLFREAPQSETEVPQTELERKLAAIDRQATDKMLDTMEQELDIKINRVSRDQMPKGHEYDKGYYNPQTGEMTICMDNVADERDAIATVFHETVAHHGLRRLFGDHFQEAMRQIYENLDSKGRAWVHNYIRTHGLSFGDAEIIRGMEEYMASLAESGDFKDTVWNRIKEILERIVDAIFGTNGFVFTDNELQYILRASYENLKNPGWLNTVEGRAANTLLKWQSGVNNSRGRRVDPELEEASLLWRDGETFTSAVNAYEEGMLDKWNAVVRENQDADLPVKLGMEAVMKEVGMKTLEENMDYLTRHNLASSRAETEAHDFELFHFTPLLEQVRTIQAKLMGGAKGKQAREDAYNRTIDYMLAVSGLERNEYKNNEIEQLKQDALQVARDKAEEKRDKVRKSAEPQSVKDRAIAEIDQALKDKEQTIEEKYEGMKKDWSGLTGLMGMEKEQWREAEQAASRMVEAFKASVGDESMLDDLWRKVRSCTDFSLEHAYKHGLLTREEYEKLHGTPSQPRMWDYYLPLRGFAEGTAEEAYGYANLVHQSANSVVTRKMKGRSTRADDPLANILNIAETEIVQGNDNWAKQALYRFVLAAGKNSLLREMEPWFEKDGDGNWMLAEPYAIDPATGEPETFEDFEARMQKLHDDPDGPQAKKGRQNLKLDKIMANKGNKHAHLIRLKVGGVEKAIWVNGDPALAQAVTGMGRKQNAQIIRRASRALSNLFTTYSLDFTIRNLFRDTMYATLGLLVKENGAYRRQFVKNWVKNFGFGAMAFPMIRLMAMWESGKLQTKEKLSDTEKMFIDFMHDGGQTGYTIINSVQTIKNELMRSMRQAGKKVSSVRIPVLGHLAQGIKTLNEAFELMTRFTTYQTSRDMGRSGQRAASDAKEISVNFNRRGAQSGEGVVGWIAAYLGATHYFYNAGVQGFDNFLHLFKVNPVKSSAAMAALIVSGMAAPLLNSMLAGLGDGDDDDKKTDPDWYWQLPEWVRRNNIVLGWGGWYLAIPLSVELRAAYGLGDIAASMMYHKTPARNGFNIALDAINTLANVLPVNPLEGYTANGNIADAVLRAITPDALIFVVDLSTNRDYTGRPLWKENPFSGEGAKCQSAYASTPKALVDACQVLARTTGIDLAPGAVRDVAKNLGGGFYKLTEQTFKALDHDMERPWRWSDIPFFSGITGHLDEDRSNSFENNALYSYKKLSEGVVKNMSIASGKSLTSSDIYDDEKLSQLPVNARMQKILEGERYVLGKMYYQGMHNQYVWKQRVRDTKAGEAGSWYKSTEVDRYGVDAYRKKWRTLFDEWKEMPEKTRAEKDAKKAAIEVVDDAWHTYCDAQGGLVDALMEEEYRNSENRRKNR